MMPTTLNAKQAAKYLGISYWKLLDMTKKGNIPYIPIGRLKLFRKETLDLWLTAKEDISIKPIIPYKHTRLNRIPG